MKHSFCKNICTLGGIGFITKAPGTIGSMLGLIFCVLSLLYVNIYLYYFILFFLFIFSIYSIYIYQIKIGKKDNSEIIIDEFFAQQIPLLFIETDFLNIVMSFTFFRLFDIFKPFPVNFIDRNYSGSLGVMLDDVLAAIQTLIIILIIRYIIVWKYIHQI